MPAMGDSVSEGTILEWHKQEGDSVTEDETIVEISTDKVDAEVPSPASGTVVKVHAAEGDTVHVGALLAEIALDGAAGAEGNGAATIPEPAAAEATRRRAEAAAPARGRDGRDHDAGDGRVGVRGRHPRVGQAAGRRGRGGRDDRRDLHRQGRRRGARARRGRDGRDPRPARRHRDRRPGDRAPDVGGAGAAPPPAPEAKPAEPAEPGASRRRSCSTTASASRPSPAASRRPRASTSRGIQGTGPAGRIQKDDVLAAARQRQGRDRSGRRERHPHQGRPGDARALHGRVAVDPTATLFRTLTVTGSTRAARSSRRRPQGLLHAPDRLRDRARRDRADAGDGPPLLRDRRQAVPRRRWRASTSASPSTSRRRTAGAR